MFHLIQLRFSHHKALAAQHMEGHKAWLQQGFDEGVFLVSGSLDGGQGGCVLAHGEPAEVLRSRVQQDPFVAEGVVSAEITSFVAHRADARMAFLVG